MNASSTDSLTLKEKFTSLVGDIINSELNNGQKEQFIIEGNSMIDDLFETEATSSVNKEGKFDLDFGLTPESIEVFQSGIGFCTVIVSCFNVLLEYRKLKKSMVDKKLEQFEVIQKIKSELEAQKMNPELASKISEKYNDRLMDLIESI